MMLKGADGNAMEDMSSLVSSNSHVEHLTGERRGNKISALDTAFAFNITVPFLFSTQKETPCYSF